MPDANMLRVDLDHVANALPAAVRRVHGASVDRMNTAGDGACSIHSVWGDWENGELFMRNARSFPSDAFGPTAERFRPSLKSDELMAELEVALWVLLAPIAKQSRQGYETPKNHTIRRYVGS